MSFNQFMHPRNAYRNKPNYDQLAILYPEFKSILKFDFHNRPFIDYADPRSLRILTTTLLKHDFDLNVQIPEQRLVPTLPMRLNYLLWVEDLLIYTKIDSNNSTITGLDIGTGCCAIFCLLGVCLNRKWNFIGTEIDEVNLECAKMNVDNNHYANHVKICMGSNENMFINLLQSPEISKVNFVMTNPPFFSDEYNDSFEESNKRESKFHYKKNCTSSSSEAVVDGGEVMFVKRIIEESLQAKSRIDLYTVMVGRRKSFLDIKYLFKNYENEKLISSFTHTELCQGNTKRWAFAWSFDHSFNLALAPRIKCIKQKPLMYNIPVSITCCEYSMKSIAEFVEYLLTTDLQILTFSMLETRKSFEFDIKSNINTWGNQRKKRRENKQKEQLDEASMQASIYDLNDANQLTFKRTLEDEHDVIQHNQVELDLKRQKAHSEKCKADLTFLLHCGLKIKRNKQQVYLKMITKELSPNKDSTFQLLQYFKNKFI